MIMQDAIYTILEVSLPAILVGLVIGLMISIFQAATQVNEQTLTFVPKIVGIFVAILIFGGMMVTNLTDFGYRVYEYALMAVA